MLTSYSVKDLYPLALAEGEGMGTAYEYYVKRMAIGRFLKDTARPQSVLIAGLPEKYGTSLDFILLATELGATVTVIDERQAAIQRLRDSLNAVRALKEAPPVNPPADILLADLGALSALRGRFDIALSSEVIQRLTTESRAAYVNQLCESCDAIGLFCPNAANQAHNTRSGLAGLRLEELRGLVTMTSTAGRINTPPAVELLAGYIDMPPFPPGITRTAEQREDATSGGFEAAVMWGLGVYAHAERFVPAAIRQRESHIVFALMRN